jgi:hypothetical protein
MVPWGTLLQSKEQIALPNLPSFCLQPSESDIQMLSG